MFFLSYGTEGWVVFWKSVNVDLNLWIAWSGSGDSSACIFVPVAHENVSNIKSKILNQLLFKLIRQHMFQNIM